MWLDKVELVPIRFRKKFYSILQNKVERNIVVKYDRGYGASWSLSDEENIRKDFLRIQNGTLDPHVFINRLDRFHNDQTVWLDKTRKYFEPLKVGIRDDKVVNEGLTRFAEYASGISIKIFDVYAIGTGITTVTAKDFVLAAEVIRLPIIDNGGYIQNRGSTNFWGLMFPRTVETIKNPNISESAIFDDTDATVDQMLLRTVFPVGEEIEHVVNEDAFSFNHVIYNSSV